MQSESQSQSQGQSQSPVFGYREFYLGRGRLLYGMFNRPWESAEMEAECLCYLEGRTIPINGIAPIDLRPHHCGIYLVRQPITPIGYIGAVCVGWGKVIEHERGWRAQHCRIEYLILPRRPTNFMIETVPFLEEHYGVPVKQCEPL
jgi:hypothetical protein